MSEADTNVEVLNVPRTLKQRQQQQQLKFVSKTRINGIAKVRVAQQLNSRVISKSWGSVPKQ